MKHPVYVAMALYCTSLTNRYLSLGLFLSQKLFFIQTKISYDLLWKYGLKWCCHMDFRNVSSNLYTVIITRYNKSMFNVPWWKVGFNTKWRKTLSESNWSLNNGIKISVKFPCSTAAQYFPSNLWWKIGCTILCKYLLKWLFVENRYYVC